MDRGAGGTSWRRSYDKRAWRRLSAAKLQAQLLCEPCLHAGRVEPAKARWLITSLQIDDVPPRLDQLDEQPRSAATASVLLVVAAYAPGAAAGKTRRARSNRSISIRSM